MKKLIVLSGAFLLGACAHSINLHTAENYFHTGEYLVRNNNWGEAREAFRRAWINANAGRANDRAMAVYAYEYGRSSGAICDWQGSEKGLLSAYELDQAADGPVYMSLYEIARMYHAKGDIQKAYEYFARAKTALDAIQAETQDAIGYADFLKGYALVLEQLGRASEAADLRKRESEIREVFKGKKSFVDLTPYGEFCDQNPADGPGNVSGTGTAGF